MKLEIQWWGTASFRLTYGRWTGLLDPYVTRNPYSRPKVTLPLADLARGASHAFLSHGHFDHVIDTPALQKANPSLKIHGPKEAYESVSRDGADPYRTQRVRGGESFAASGITVDVLDSAHVHFDLPLIADTLKKALVSPASKEYLRPWLLTKYPCGETFSYVFHFGGFRLMFLGSAGPTDTMLRAWHKRYGTIDCLLVPVQGNTRICEIAANIVEKLQPRSVIPHHHDDFYPPVSRMVDITPFHALIAENARDTKLIELPVGGSHAWEIAEKAPSASETRPGAAASL